MSAVQLFSGADFYSIGIYRHLLWGESRTLFWFLCVKRCFPKKRHSSARSHCQQPFWACENYSEELKHPPPFLPAAKMVNEAARLLFTRRQPLFTQNQRFSSHLHQFREALLVKSFHYAVASLHLWSRSFHSLVKLPPPAGGCVTFTARLCRLISFISKTIAVEHSSNGIFNKKSSDNLIQPEISISPSPYRKLSKICNPHL